MEAKPIEKDMELFGERHPAVVESASAIPVSSTPADLLAIAVSQNADMAKLEKLMELQEKWEKNEARKAYARAMAKFKSNPPEILKTKHVSYQNSKNQTVEWDHAVLGEIAAAIIKGMSPCGLYHRWNMEQPDANTVKTTCIITHELGHSESTSMQGPPDISGGKDTLKAVASTNTLLQRLTLLALTGLAAKGMDNENPPDVVAYITEEEQADLEALMSEVNADVPKFLKYFGISDLSELPANKYKTAVKALEAKRA